MQQQDPIVIIYKSVGEEPFWKLVDEFYDRVEQDPVLRPIYPEDLSDSKKHLGMFLIQRSGGPTTYSDERGHPRMRMRHMPFKIGQAEKDAWLKNMYAALECVPEFAAHKDNMRYYFADFAAFLVNHPD